MTATAYTERGWHVFPVRARDKRPVIERWEDRATDDTDRVARWWRDHADDNIGIACGPSQLLVVDLDVKGDADGIRNFVFDVVPAPHVLPETYIVETPSGGLHLYFATTTNDEFRNSASRLGSGIDTRAGGGYVVAAGSRTTLGVYIEAEVAAVVPVPAWLRARLEVRYSTPVRPNPATHRLTAATSTTARGWSPAGLFGKMAVAVAGERNSVLHWCAARIGEDVAAGKVEEDSAIDALGMLADVARRAGLDDREISATIRSGYRP